MFELELTREDFEKYIASHPEIDAEQAHAYAVEGVGLFDRYRILRAGRVMGYIIIK